MITFLSDKVCFRQEEVAALETVGNKESFKKLPEGIIDLFGFGTEGIITKSRKKE